MIAKKCACLIICVCVSAISTADIQSRYYGSVVSGDISWMLLEQLDQKEDQSLVRHFKLRFIDRQEVPAFESIEDDFVRKIAGYYQDYWTDSLLDPNARYSREKLLEQRIEQALAEYGNTDFDADLFERLSTVIREKDWGFQGGRTQPLLDFILWRNTESKQYDVVLSDTTQTVTVNFLDDFVSQGWAHFATFGHHGTGGWADQNALYCIAEHYDLTSERFLFSYLKHEARHYADYQRYPNLVGADLEYRAKLTELIYADVTQHTLLKHFSSQANRDTDIPHPLANWHVLNDLAQTLGLVSSPANAEHWQFQNADSIRSAARVLLQRHDQRLRRSGADTSTGVLSAKK